LRLCKHCGALVPLENCEYSVRFLLAEFLEGGICAQRVPDRIEP
jgi:hypothetical protein